MKKKEARVSRTCSTPGKWNRRKDRKRIVYRIHNARHGRARSPGFINASSVSPVVALFRSPERIKEKRRRRWDRVRWKFQRTERGPAEAADARCRRAKRRPAGRLTVGRNDGAARSTLSTGLRHLAEAILSSAREVASCSRFSHGLPRREFHAAKTLYRRFVFVPGPCARSPGSPSSSEPPEATSTNQECRVRG